MSRICKAWACPPRRDVVSSRQDIRREAVHHGRQIRRKQDAHGGLRRGRGILFLLLAALVLIMALGGREGAPGASPQPGTPPAESAPPAEATPSPSPSPSPSPTPSPQPEASTPVVSAIAGRGGSISPARRGGGGRRRQRDFHHHARRGFAVAQLLVDGEAVEASGSYTFQRLASDHTIYVTFLPPSPRRRNPPPPLRETPLIPRRHPGIPGEGPEEPAPRPLPAAMNLPLSGGDPQLEELIDWILGQAQGEP